VCASLRTSPLPPAVPAEALLRGAKSVPRAAAVLWGGERECEGLSRFANSRRSAPARPPCAPVHRKTKRLSSAPSVAACSMGDAHCGRGVSHLANKKPGPKAPFEGEQPQVKALSPQAARQRVIEILDDDASMLQYPDDHVARRQWLTAMARRAGDPLLLVEALLFMLISVLQAGRPEDAAADLAEAKAIARSADDPGSSGLCELAESVMEFMAGDTARAVALARSALPAMAFTRNPPYRRLQVVIFLAMVFDHLEMAEESVQMSEQASRLAQEQAKPFILVRARYLSLMGRLARCIDAATELGQLPPDDPEVCSIIADLREIVAQTEDSRSITSDGAVVCLVQCLGMVGLEGEAIDLYARRIDAKAQRWMSPVTLAILSIATQPPRRAAELLNACNGPETSLPNSERIRLLGNLAIAHSRLGDYRAAFNALHARSAVQLQSTTESAIRKAAVLNFDLETERNKLATQRALVHAGKLAAVGQLASSLAHEISQPSAALMLLSDEARGHLAAGRQAAALTCLQEVEQQTERLRRLVNRMKDFSRDDPVHIQKVSLDQVAEEAYRLLRPSLRDAGVVCTLEVPALIVMTDKERVILSLVNLVNNAVDALRGQQSTTARA
jgi:signal transduction histidine kinase